jgi:hypothetical protein
MFNRVDIYRMSKLFKRFKVKQIRMTLTISPLYIISAE